MKRETRNQNNQIESVANFEYGARFQRKPLFFVCVCEPLDFYIRFVYATVLLIFERKEKKNERNSLELFSCLIPMFFWLKHKMQKRKVEMTLTQCLFEVLIWIRVNSYYIIFRFNLIRLLWVSNVLLSPWSLFCAKFNFNLIDFHLFAQSKFPFISRFPLEWRSFHYLIASVIDRTLLIRCDRWYEIS